MKAVIEVIGGAMDGKQFIIKRTSHIGRDEDNELSIPTDKYISRRHASLICTEQGYQLKDLNSTNGTYINENIVKEPVMLENEQLFRVGRTYLKIRYLS